MPNTTEIPPPSELARPDVGPAPSSSNAPPKRRPVLKISLIIVGVLLIAGGIFAPLAAKTMINQYLKTQFSSAIALQHLGFNPFTSRLTLSMQKNSPLVLDRFRMEWDWLPLLRRTVRLNEIHLKNLTVEIKPLADGGVQIGDIHLEGAAKAVSQAVESGQPHLPIYLDVRDVVLENVHLKYTDPQLQATLGFDRVELRATGASGAAFLHYGLLKNSGQQLDFTGEVRISGLVLEPPVMPKSAAEQSAALQKLQGLTALFSGLVKVSGLHVALQADPKSGRSTPAFRVDSVELADNAAVRLQAKNNRTPLDVTFQPVDVQVKNLDLARPGDETSVTVQTAAGGNSSVRYSLKGKPLEKPFSLTGTGQIARLSLPPFSLLAERFIGYRIPKGILNLDPNLSVKQGLLDSKWNMVLNQFEVEKIEAGGRDPVADVLGVSLDSSVKLLKDKKGDIHLEIPVKADLNDPNLAVSAMMSRAITAGIKSAVRASLNKVLSPVSSN